MSTEPDDVDLVAAVPGSTNLTIILRDDDTGVEVRSSVHLMTAQQGEARRALGRAFSSTLERLWPLEDSHAGA